MFSGVNLEIHDTDRIGMVGPNGGGKTSLLRVLVRQLQPDSGGVTGSEGLRIGYVPQAATPSTNGTLRDEILTAFDKVRKLEEELATSAQEIQRSTDENRRLVERRYSSLLAEYEAVGGYDLQHRIERVVDGVGLSRTALDTAFGSASGGERTRAALARALLTDPDLLVLDEPTNYLDFKGLAWLEDFLQRFSHAFLVVSHDRYFLDQVVRTIWEMDRGKLTSFPGNYTKHRALKAERLERQNKEYERQQEFIAKEQYFIDRYHAGQRSREAKGREKRLQRIERLDAPTTDRTVRLAKVDASRTGLLSLSTHGLTIGFSENGTQTPLISVPDIDLERGSKTAIVGANGAGKTTLLQTILGITAPISGSVEYGYGVKPGYFHQGNIDLPDEGTVMDALLDEQEISFEEVRTYLARFLFSGEDVFKPVAALSGGERARLSLARLLAAEPNVLVLDEPTTHLDIPSREALEQVLLGYAGTLLFVTHDRRLISLLATQLWIVENGGITVFDGTFEEWTKSQQAEAIATKTRKRTRQRKLATTLRKPPPEPTVNYEAIISDLEAKLAKIESRIQTATKRQAGLEIAELGVEYNKTRSELETAWDAWGE